MKKFFSLITLLCFVLSACNVASPSPTVMPIMPNSINGYPVPPTQSLSQLSTAYPDPLAFAVKNVDPKTITPPKEAPVPESGKASISGILFSKSSSTILTNFRLYVTLAQGPDKNAVPPILAGPIKDLGDVTATTGQDGKFEFNNLNPGNYYLIVVMPTDYSVVEKSLTDEQAQLIQLSPNQQNPIGLAVIQ